MKKSWIIIVIQSIIIVYLFITLVDIDKKMNETIISVSEIVRELEEVKKPNFSFCMSSLSVDTNLLGNSKTKFCNKRDARVWAYYETLSLNGNWRGMQFEIFEIETQNDIIYSVEFFE